MVKKSFEIIPKSSYLQDLNLKVKYFSLETADFEDIENLRIWKNENRQYFFRKKIISKEEQINWFDEYLKKDDDYIFVVNYNHLKIGCAGFRLINNLIDIYNVILGSKELSSKGIMSFALKFICSYILDNYKNDITVRVLLDNPARKWYIKNNFVEIEIREDHVFSIFDTSNFQYMEYDIKLK